MIFKPEKGTFKDNFILFEGGKFYLFAMYAKDGAPRDENGYRNVYLAVSDDGVHWEERGAVIEEAPFPIWAMAVHRAGGQFILNHGSFGADGKQNVIKQWASRDLLHWTYLGEERDVHPDFSQCGENARLDCMYVLHEEDGYYAFATGPQWLFYSKNGVDWQSLPTPRIEWGDYPPSPMPADEGIFEVAGCEKVGGRYYLVGGWFNYLGYPGYGDHVLSARSPKGPFSPCSPKYRLNGHSERWVCLWARFCRTPDELLVSSYMADGYSYECGSTWLPPLKKVLCGTNSISLGYWQGNESLKGEVLPAGSGSFRPVPFAAGAVLAGGEGVSLKTNTCRSSLCRLPTEICAAFSPCEEIAGGVVLEGELCFTSPSPRETDGAAGFYLPETEKGGTAMLVGTSGVLRIGHFFESNGAPVFVPEDESRTGIYATATRIEQGKKHAFRLFVRRNMFELYIDGVLAQTFNTAHEYPQAGAVPSGIGFAVENGCAEFSHLKMWKMSLEGGKGEGL